MGLPPLPANFYYLPLTSLDLVIRHASGATAKLSLRDSGLNRSVAAAAARIAADWNVA